MYCGRLFSFPTVCSLNPKCRITFCLNLCNLDNPPLGFGFCCCCGLEIDSSCLLFFGWGSLSLVLPQLRLCPVGGWCWVSSCLWIGPTSGGRSYRITSIFLQGSPIRCSSFILSGLTVFFVFSSLSLFSSITWGSWMD